MKKSEIKVGDEVAYHSPYGMFYVVVVNMSEWKKVTRYTDFEQDYDFLVDGEYRRLRVSNEYQLTGYTKGGNLVCVAALPHWEGAGWEGARTFVVPVSRLESKAVVEARIAKAEEERTNA